MFGEVFTGRLDSHLGVLLASGVVRTHLLLQLKLVFFQLVHLRNNKEAASLEETVEKLHIFLILLLAHHGLVFDPHDLDLIVVHHEVLLLHSQKLDVVRC